MTSRPTVSLTASRNGVTPGVVARIVATVLAFVAAVALVIGTIGPPLVGNGVFLTSDFIYFAAPWHAHGEPDTEMQAHLAGPTTDTVDVVYPARAVFGSQARDRHFLGWNPWNFGGEPLGATSNMGQLNPLAWPFLFLPGWLAPAMVKLAGMASALGFTYLFCRRLGTDRVPAVLGAVVYAGSGFIVMWNNWPQADVASLIPALFWATERFLQKRTASSAVPIALALAALLLAMFPAVVGYALTVLAGYVAFRLGAALLTERRRWAGRGPGPAALRPIGVPAPAVTATAATSPVNASPSAVSPVEASPVEASPVEASPVEAGPDGAERAPAAPDVEAVAASAEEALPAEAEAPAGLTWKQTLVAGLGSVAALAAGVLLVAVVLLPFGARLSSSELEREQTPESILYAATLVTAGAPGVFGLSSDGVNFNGPTRNQIESISYVGVVGLLLSVGAVALPRVRRAPPGATVGLAVTTVLMGIATYGGGPLLEFLQRFPVYDMNFIGRARSILCLTVAALAALGLQALIERGKAERLRSLRPLDVLRFVGVAGAAGWFTVWVYRAGHDFARTHERAKAFADSIPSARAIGLVALVVIAVLLVGRGPGRHLLAAGLVVLATVQGLILAVPLLPNESRDTLYPETAGLVFLREHQGTDRVVPEKYTLYANATMLQGIRSITGHGFHAPTWKEMLNVASPGAFASSPTLGQLSGDPVSVSSPIYDRMGARWFAGMPSKDPFGTRETLTLDRADCGQIADARIVSTYADMSYGLWGVPYTRAGQQAPTPPGSATAGAVEAAPVGPPAGAAPASTDPTAGATAGGSDGRPAGPAGIVPEGNVVARLRVPGENGLNGVVVRLCETTILPQGSAFHVTAVAGDVTATGILPIRGGVTFRDLALPVAGGDLAGDAPIDVTVTLQNPDANGVFLAAGPGGGIAADLIRPDDDGLRLAYAGDLRIYERMNALPRIHWAGRSAVVRNAPERVDMLGSGSVPDDTVILSAGRAGGSGLGGTVKVHDGTGRTRIEVDAEGDGYVVIADGIQNDWVATLDGEPVELVDADHSGVAVAVPAGTHEIEVKFRPRGQKAGAALSALTAVGLLIVGAASLVLQFRRRRRPAAASVAGPGPDGAAAGPVVAEPGESVRVIAPPTPPAPPPHPLPAPLVDLPPGAPAPVPPPDGTDPSPDGTDPSPAVAGPPPDGTGPPSDGSGWSPAVQAPSAAVPGPPDGTATSPEVPDASPDRTASAPTIPGLSPDGTSASPAVPGPSPDGAGASPTAPGAAPAVPGPSPAHTDPPPDGAGSAPDDARPVPGGPGPNGTGPTPDEARPVPDEARPVPGGPGPDGGATTPPPTVPAGAPRKRRLRADGPPPSPPTTVPAGAPRGGPGADVGESVVVIPPDPPAPPSAPAPDAPPAPSPDGEAAEAAHPGDAAPGDTEVPTDASDGAPDGAGGTGNRYDHGELADGHGSAQRNGSSPAPDDRPA